MEMIELTAHPASEAFPMMDEARFAELKLDIDRNGLREPITIYGGQILDGRNRAKACKELGIEPSTVTFDGDPWAYVWSLNGQRRDLVAEQRYLIWKFVSEKSDAFQSEQARIAEQANRKRSEAAKKQHEVSKPYAGERKPKMVVGHNVPLPSNDQHKGKQSKASASKTNSGAVSRGDKLAANHPDLAEKVRRGLLKPAAAHREAKKREASGKVAALPKDKHTVIYADPPWKYNDAQAVKGDYGTGTGSALGHYPAMTLTELKALDIEALAATDSVLFLWATSPLLPDSLALAHAWGFKYKAMFVWDKVKHNMGHYNSVRHELLLICTRGSCTPQVSKLFDSVQSIERTKHSEKPEEFRKIIETLYPKGRKIELFARKKTKGWRAWGNEC